MEEVNTQPERTLCNYNCPDCHTSFSTMKDNVLTCVYCGGTKITKHEEASYPTYSFVPFMINIEDAFEEYKSKMGFNPLLPYSFRSSNVINKIRKVYLPCTLFDLNVEGNISFIGADKATKVQNAPKQSFESMYSTHFDYLNLLTSHYSKLDDEIVSNVNNYNFALQEKLDTNMLGDAYIINGDLEAKKIAEAIQDKVTKYSLNVVKSSVEHEIKKIDKNELVMNVNSAKDVYIPLYVLNINYKGKECLFVINGQTGEVLGDFPISPISVIIFSIIVFIIIFLVSFVLAHFI